MSNPGEHIRVRCEHGILTLTLDRPAKLNALTPEMIEGLRRGIERAREDDVRVVVMLGTGRAFCAGADVQLALGLTAIGASYAFLAGLADVLEGLSSLPKPVIAAIQGHAVGGGAELALEADLRIVSEDAILGFPDVAIGSTPASVYQLVRHVGKALAARMVMLGTELRAEDMRRLELAVEVVAPDELEAAALSLAARLRDRAGANSLRFAKEGLAIAEKSERALDLRANVAAMLACQSGAEQNDYVSTFSRRTGG